MKKLAFHLFILVPAMALFASVACAQSLTDDQIRQQILGQPPARVVADAQRLATNGVPATIEVDWIKADLDGNGGFLFLIARFNAENSQSGHLRVFEIRDQTIVLRGDQDKPEEVAAGSMTKLYLEDINSDGLPEVRVDSVSNDAVDHYSSVFGWTGAALHNLFGDDVMNGDFADIDSDGVSEVIVKADAGGFDVYKLTGIDYHFDKNYPSDPTGISNNGTLNYVRALCRALDPDTFPLAAIRQALQGKQQNGNDSVHLRFGGLEKVGGGGMVDVSQVDQATIRVSPNLMPLRVSLLTKEPGNGPVNSSCKGAAPPRVNVDVSRTDFLKSLQRLKLDAPLASGDQLELRLTGKLLDGTPFSAIFTARVNGN
jgi:hypothetical protein